MAVAFPPLPQIGDTFSSGDKTWKWNGLGWEKVLPARPFYGIASFYDGAPEAGELLAMHTPAWVVEFPADLFGSQGHALTAPSSTADFLIKKGGTLVATMRFSAGQNQATFLTSAAFSLAAGDLLTVEAPAVQDASLAGISFTLSGNR